MCRNKEVKVKFSKDEIETISRRALNAGMKVSSYLRFVALKSQIKVETIQ